VHEADIAAHDGIDTALGVGDGEVDALGLGLGVGDSEGEGEADALDCVATLLALPHAVSAKAATSASTPTLRLTRKTNGWAGVGVTDR
jgi:hypothetical protein